MVDTEEGMVEGRVEGIAVGIVHSRVVDRGSSKAVGSRGKVVELVVEQQEN